MAVDKPSIRAGSRILLLDGGSLDKVRTWDGQGEWENRVSSLTAENIAWLDSQYHTYFPLNTVRRSLRS